MPTPTYHVTEQGTFNRCIRKWFLANRECLEPKVKHFNFFWFGTLGHGALNALYSTMQKWQQQGRQGEFNPNIGLSHFDALYKAETADLYKYPEAVQEKVLDMGTLGRGIIEGYFPTAIQDSENWHIISVEQPYRIKVTLPSGEEVWYEGTPDLVVEIDGDIWVVDHKFYASFVDPADLMTDAQMSKYIWLVSKVLGRPVKGAIYNQFLKKLPAEPQLLKSGKGLSKDKSIVTTVEKYTAAIVQHGFALEEYAEVLDRIAGYSFYKREKVMRTPKQLQIVEERLPFELQRVDSAVGAINFPSLCRDCRKDCRFQELCLCLETGGPYEATRDALFNKGNGDFYGTKFEDAE